MPESSKLAAAMQIGLAGLTGICKLPQARANGVAAARRAAYLSIYALSVARGHEQTVVAFVPARTIA